MAGQPPDPFGDVLGTTAPLRAAAGVPPDPFADVTGASTRTSTPRPHEAYKPADTSLAGRWNDLKTAYSEQLHAPNQPTGGEYSQALLGGVGDVAKGMALSSPLGVAITQPFGKTQAQKREEGISRGERLYQAQESGSPTLKALGYVEAAGVPMISDTAGMVRNFITPTAISNQRPPTKEEMLGSVRAGGQGLGALVSGKVIEAGGKWLSKPKTQLPLPKPVMKLSKALGPESVQARGSSVEEFNVAARALGQHGEVVTHPAQVPEAASRIVKKTLLANTTLMERPEANIPMLDPAQLGDRAFNTKDLPFTLTPDETKFITRIKNNVTGEAKMLGNQQGGLITAEQADGIRRRIEVDYDNLFERNDKLRNEMAWKLRDSYGRGITAAIGEDYPKLHQEMADAMHLQKISGGIAEKSIAGVQPKGKLTQAAAKAASNIGFGWYRGAAAEGAASMLPGGAGRIADIPKFSRAAAEYYKGSETVTDRILRTAQPTGLPQGRVTGLPGGPPPTTPAPNTPPLAPGTPPRPPGPLPGANPPPTSAGPQPAPEMPPEAAQGGTAPTRFEGPPIPDRPTHLTKGQKVSGHDATGNLISGDVMNVYPLAKDGNTTWMVRVMDHTRGTTVELPAADVFDRMSGPPKGTGGPTTINPTKGPPKGPKSPKVEGPLGGSSGPEDGGLAAAPGPTPGSAEKVPFNPATAAERLQAEMDNRNPSNPFPSEWDRNLSIKVDRLKNRYDPESYPRMSTTTAQEVLQRAKDRPVKTPAVVIDRTLEGNQSVRSTPAHPEEVALVRDAMTRIAEEYPRASRIVGRVELVDDRFMVDHGLLKNDGSPLGIYYDEPGGRIFANIKHVRSEISQYGPKAVDGVMYHEMIHAAQHVLGVKGTTNAIEASAYRKQFATMGGEDYRGPFKDSGGPPPSPKELKHGPAAWRGKTIIRGGVPVKE